MEANHIHNLPNHEEEKKLDYLQEFMQQHDNFIAGQKNNLISLFIKRISDAATIYATASIILPLKTLSEKMLSAVPYLPSEFSYKNFGQALTLLFLRPTADIIDTYRGALDALKMLEFLLARTSKDNRYHNTHPSFNQTHLEAIQKTAVYIQETLSTMSHKLLRTMSSQFSYNNSMVLVIEALDFLGNRYYRNNEIIKSRTTLLDAKSLCEKLLGDVDVKDTKKLYQALKAQSNLFTAISKNKDQNIKIHQSLYLTELYISILYNLGKCHSITSPKEKPLYFEQARDLCAEVLRDLEINLLYSRLVESNGLKPLGLIAHNDPKSQKEIKEAIDGVKEIKAYYKKLLDSNV